MMQHSTFWKYEVPEVSHKYRALMLSDHPKPMVKKNNNNNPKWRWTDSMLGDIAFVKFNKI